MKLSNTFDIPLPLAVWLASDSYDYINDEKYISATQLLKPAKQICLGKQASQIDVVTDISEWIPAQMGTSLHDGIESAWLHREPKKALVSLGISESVVDKIKVNPEKVSEGDIPVYIEQRAVRDLKGYKVGGKFDFVLDGKLHDFKSTSVYTWIFGSKDEDYKLQGSIYKWLNPDKITEDSIRICFIFTDWNATEAKIKDDYPKSRIMYKDIPLMSNVETEKWISDKLDQITTYMGKSEKDMPQCTDEELWRKPGVWKYYSKPDAVRATKNFDSEKEARDFSTGKPGIIKFVPGEVRRCQYCAAAPICEQRKQYFND